MSDQCHGTFREEHDNDLEALEDWLLRRLDESILFAEELDLWKRYEHSIREAEEKKQQQQQQQQKEPKVVVGARIVRNEEDRDPWLSLTNNDDHTTGRQSTLAWQWKRDHEDAAAATAANISKNSSKVIAGSVQGLEYVQASKLIPRNSLCQGILITKSRVRNMAEQFQRQHWLPPVYYAGFRVELRSAHPDAWRLIVWGYRKTVQLFHQKILQHEIVLPPPSSHRQQQSIE